jgi:hypothetical protein
MLPAAFSFWDMACTPPDLQRGILGINSNRHAV